MKFNATIRWIPAEADFPALGDSLYQEMLPPAAIPGDDSFGRLAADSLRVAPLPAVDGLSPSVLSFSEPADLRSTPNINFWFHAAFAPRKSDTFHHCCRMLVRTGTVCCV